jgi:ribonuclease HII
VSQKGVLERQLLDRGLSFIGVDEVGRGCLAGPVVAACVRLDYANLFKLPEKSLSLIRDSKTLSSKQRQVALGVLAEVSIESRVGSASAREIEVLGILKATFLAMNRAICLLEKPVDHVLIDGNQKIPDLKTDQTAIVKGDALCFSIAAASIIAKEHRDQFMSMQAAQYPHYGFEANVGYGTAAHLTAIEQRGICTLHRRTFAPIKDYVVSFDH